MVPRTIEKQPMIPEANAMKAGTKHLRASAALDREQPRDAAPPHCTGGGISLLDHDACAVHVLTS
jgi:hypothetical protein